MITLAHELAHSILHTKDIDENGGYLDFYRLVFCINVKVLLVKKVLFNR